MKEHVRKKKLLQIVLSICFVVTALGTVKTNAAKTFAAESDFVISNGVLKGYTGSAIVVEVPDGVKQISGGFSGRKDIERVILPDSVEYIGNSAFYGCTGLTEVVMSKKLVSIGTSAFRGCTGLQTMDLSRTSIVTIPQNAFYGCTSLTDVKLPQTLQVVGFKAFYDCEHLGRINLPEGVCSIANFAFHGCHALCSITLPDSLRYLGRGAFDDCIALESIAIPEGIAVLQENVFEGDYSLKNVYLPDSLRVILKGALETSNHYTSTGGVSGSGSLTSVYIPSSVECIGKKVFDSTGKMSVVKGTTDSYAAAYAEKNSLTLEETEGDAKIIFDACGGTVDVTEKSVVTGQEYGVLPVPVLKGYTFTGWYADRKFKKQIKSTTIVKNASVTVYARWEKTEIAEVTYKGYSSDFTIKSGVLTKYTGYQPVVVVPEGVTKIASAAFEGCHTITTIILPDSLTKIGSSAFEKCTSLVELEIPKGVTEIPEEMCFNCTNLQKVVIPEGVTRIGKSAFSGNTNVCNEHALQLVSLPDSLQSIGNNAFWYCSNLVEINLPDSLTDIGKSAFSDCSALRKIAIPSGVTMLNSNIFADCCSLEDIVLTDGLQQINDKILQGDCQFDTIYIPESVTTMTEKALWDSTAKKEFTIEGIKNSTAYNYYEGTQNSSNFKNIDVSFKELTYDATIAFDTQVSGLAADDKKAIVGKAYGVLPVLEQEGNIFKGWSLTKEGTDLVKSTDMVEAENVTLHAVWKNPSEEEKPGDEVEEPDGVPTLLPSEEDDEATGNLEYTEIATAEALSKIRENLSGNYRLTADIDLSEASKVGGTCDLDGYGWRPIGASAEGPCEAFTGIFDGNGHTIKGLTITGEVPYYDVGLFARVKGGTIQNLTLEDCALEIGGSAVRSGILAGYAGTNEETGKDAVIKSCSITTGEIKFLTNETVISKNIAIGGFAGYMGEGILSNCKNEADVTYFSNVQEKPEAACSRFLGGIAGYLNGGEITKCSNEGVVTCFRNYYGDFTDAQKGDWVAAALSGCDVYGITGGICGVGAENGSISECYNTGSISAYMFNEYNLLTLNVTSHVNTMAGGICGELYKSTQVLNCYNTGSVQSYSDRNTTLVDETATSEDMMSSLLAMLDEITVSAPFQNAKGYAAGIVGCSTKTTSGPVKYCYSTGRLAGSKDCVYAIANGEVPVAYCRYKETNLKDKDGNESELLGSSAYDNSITRCQAIASDEMNLCEKYRSFDFANTWFLVDGSAMEAPQLYSNMYSNVKAVSFLEPEEGALKTEYEYGEKLDLTGLQVSVMLQGIEDELIMDLSGKINCGYDAYAPGEQKLTITCFGKSMEITVTVKKPKCAVVVNNGEGSGSYAEGETITIKANESEEGTGFKNWSVDTGNVTLTDANSAETTFVMGKEPVTLTAVYANMYQVTVNGGEGSGYYKEGDEVTVVSADASEGMTFTGWTVLSGGSSLIADKTLQEITFVMPKQDVELTANFENVIGEEECIDDAGHEWDEGEVTKAATCTEEGEKTHICIKCNAIKIETIAKIEHIWDEGVETKAPTATEKGTKTFTCTVCGKTKAEEIPATGTSTDPTTPSNPGGTTDPANPSNPGGTTDSTNPSNPADSGGGNTGMNNQSVVPAPAVVGTVLTIADPKCQVRVTSSDAMNPTVTYVKTTDKKAKKVTIPESVTVDGITYKVTAIADNACKNNKKLTMVVIGRNIAKIGKNAFKGCKNVKKVTVTAGNLKAIGKNAMKGINKKATITVKGSKKAALKKMLKNKKVGYVKTWNIK